jgi:hypothetical protein
MARKTRMTEKNNWRRFHLLAKKVQSKNSERGLPFVKGEKEGF